MQFDNQSKDDAINLKDILFKYLIHWKWFLVSILVFAALTKIYLRYSVPVYKASTTILIKDDQSGNLASELSAFQDIGLFSGSKNAIDDEIEILKSRSLVEKTVKKGEFNIKYISEGRIKSSDAYGANPIQIDFLNKDKKFYKKDTIVTVQILNDNKFDLLNQDNVKVGTYYFNQVVKSKELGDYKIVKKTVYNKYDEPEKITKDKISIELTNLRSSTDAFKARITVGALSKFANAVEISITDQVSKKAEDFLNQLVEIYNEDAINDKNLISEKTAKFINERLVIITEELGDVEKEAEVYKKRNRITDLPTEAELNLRSASEFKVEEASVGTQIKVVDLMINYMKTNANTDIIPANIIPSDNSSAQMIADYNNLVVERDRILKSSTPENPLVIRVNDKIASLKSSINESLLRLRSSLSVKSRDINREGSLVGGKIAKIPQQEREFRNIFRQQQIKEELYLYLFKKREETAITLAGTPPISKIVDLAYSSHLPVSPKRNMVYIVGLLLGILVPLIIIYLKNLFDTKVKSKADLDFLEIPFIGDIPHSESHNEIIKPDSRTSSAEAIRIVRTNLEFILNGVTLDKAKTIMMTSTLPSEGKTFVTVNLAATIAISGKKVLLIGMDIRNPRIDDYVALPSKGLTNFLSTPDANIEDYIVSQPGYAKFDILPAGVIPPNPAELLMSVKLETMFEDLKNLYDYIIIDTAPVSLVTDTLLISKFADAFIYVVRANYLGKEMLRIPEALYREKKLPSMCMLLNDTDIIKGYGYGYGYGANQQKKTTWYNRIFGFLG